MLFHHSLMQLLAHSCLDWLEHLLLGGGAGHGGSGKTGWGHQAGVARRVLHPPKGLRTRVVAGCQGHWRLLQVVQGCSELPGVVGPLRNPLEPSACCVPTGLDVYPRALKSTHGP